MNAPAQIEPSIMQSLYSVEGMRCAACIARIERGLPATAGIYAARVNLTARRVRVDHDPALDQDAVAEAFRSVGFDAHPFAGDTLVRPERSTESRELLLAMAVAGFAAMNVMLLSVSVWSGANGEARELFHWISALIAVPAIVFSGRPFFRSAAKALRTGRTNMDVPISIGLTLTTAMSLYETATGGAHAYFDGAVMLLFFLLAGRYLESIMRARADDTIAALLRRVPAEAAVIIGARHERRSISLLMPGDRVAVAAGERIAADGTVVLGSSEVDQSLVTGESLPIPVQIGDKVLAGTINCTRPIEVEVDTIASQSRIAKIADLMEEAAQSKSPLVTIADRAAKLYAPAVHLLAALALAGWWIAGAGVHQALLIAVSVLIITCPCALGLAVPVSQVVASGALMRSGILVRKGTAIEAMAKVDLAIFDKTGTVTIGRLEALDLPSDLEEVAILATLARSSRHPLARAVTCALGGINGAELIDVSESAGFGVEGTDDAGLVWRFGRTDWVGIDCAPSGTETVSAFGHPGNNKLIRFDDAIRPQAREAFGELRQAGVRPLILSGDRREVVDAVSSEVGVEGRSQVSPSEKDGSVQTAQRHGHQVLMVGDGLNDGPAMERADVAMAPAAASDVSQMSADFLFFGDSLRAVPIAIRASRRTLRVVKQNFGLAIAYNILAVPLAIAGYVTPLFAALAMSSSSLLVIGNALRLRWAAR